ncbi:hypothetical protein AHMF7605_06815 [Adhaeribacter arboris]|uniref:Uncharacterized protein n=1 Tax=Adhaeribacter arboris TaxID=2072846 RepID=A0A2T2YCL1_9BACT|nr:hypothetical protein [Adhaeribacter arboris]PSR53261.1 hypothetical protein AHMF7605_06815 [Adhaeribacter arboris]
MDIKLYISSRSINYNDDKLSHNSIEIKDNLEINVSENDYIYLYLISDYYLNNDAGIWLTEDWFPLRFLERDIYGRIYYECDFKSLFSGNDNFYKQFYIKDLIGGSRRFGKIFLNYFGTCEILFDSGELDILPKPVGSIEISSSKINDLDIGNIF